MKRCASIIFAVVLSSCSTGITSLYTSDYPLSDEKAYSKTSNIYVNLPRDWFVAEDNECNCTDLWIVKNDYSASISFRKINPTKAVLDALGENEIEKVAEYDKIFIRIKLGKGFDKFSNEETFQVGSNTFTAFQYTNDKNQQVRVVVFKHYDKFYESEAVANRYKDLSELFGIQNSVLSTLN